VINPDQLNGKPLFGHCPRLNAGAIMAFAGAAESTHADLDHNQQDQMPRWVG